MPSFDQDRWRRLESLFLEASDLPPDERPRFVDRETGGDGDLRRDLSGMLAHASDGGARIARAIDAVAGSLPGHSTWIGRHLGPYRVIREIGRGGMGLVFEAVRDDDEYRKTVAIKIAPPWMDAAAVRERFRLERQILAELEHPNIARFLDGGTEEGVPYFVMEYVDGLPITLFCNRQALDLRARLALFRQICGAVHFAHESLVVHRDLKPSNILVSEGGVPKLLDFGIAKLLDPFADGGATATADMRWTPDYTSPEQLRGRTITTRTDVYSLGLVLYEMLTGERAQVADQSSPLALERSICETEAARPSERATSRLGRGWANQLRGDLDTIVMTAISKEPERRYGTAAALNDDLARYLDGRPILARPSTVTYRTGKFLRRHRVGVAAAALVLVSLLGGLGAALYQAQRAEHRYQQVRALANSFVFDVYDRIEQLTGATETRKVVVQTALTYLESLRADAGNDPGLSRELAAAYFRIGDAQGSTLTANLGDPEGALVSYTRAQDLLTPLVERGDTQARLQFINLATALANFRYEQGALSEGAAEFTRAEEVGEGLLREGIVNVDLLSDLTTTYAADTRISLRSRQYPRAEQAGRRTMELIQRAIGLEPDNLELQEGLALAQTSLGQTLHLTDRLHEAADLFRSAIEIREMMAQKKPDDAVARRNLLVAYGTLADILGTQLWASLQDTAGAITALEKALALSEVGRQKDPVDRRAWFDIVNARYRLGAAMAEDPTRLESALENYAEAGRLTKQLHAEDPKRVQYAQFDALIEWRAGQVLELIGRPGDAAKGYEAARAIAVGWLKGPSGPNFGPSYVRSSAALAAIRAKAGDVQAVTLADEASRALASLPAAAVGQDAPMQRSVGAAYLEIATHSTTDRARALKEAVDHLEKSAALLRGFKPPAEVEPRRQKELREIEAELSRCQRLDP